MKNYLFLVSVISYFNKVSPFTSKEHQADIVPKIKIKNQADSFRSSLTKNFKLKEPGTNHQNHHKAISKS